MINKVKSNYNEWNWLLLLITKSKFKIKCIQTQPIEKPSYLMRS